MRIVRRTATGLSDASLSVTTMREIGRNDPCPCGSGFKYKRCCLDVAQAAGRIACEAEERIRDLGDWVRDEHLASWRTAYEQQLMPLNGFGGVPADFAAWLETWLVCDAPIIGGITPLDASAPLDPSPADEWLRASAIGGWWLRGSDFPLGASPWCEEAALVLHSDHEPLGVVNDGALLVARAIEVRPGHVALIGRPVVVDDEAVDDVLAVLADEPAKALCAALRWPERREYTADGEQVRQCYRGYRLLDAATAVAAMRAFEDATERDDLLGYWEDDTTFTVAGTSGGGVIVEPASERGVVWELCREDESDPPVMGEITISPDDDEFALDAVSAERADRLLEALPPQVRATMGELVREHLDAPDVRTRVSRDRGRQLAPVS
jgi:hypothetical protein